MSEEVSANLVVDAIRNGRNQANVSNELKRLMEKKGTVEQKLLGLEKQIYALEGSYLQDTKNIGNILSGWDSYLGARGTTIKKPLKFKESDRLFSLSSVSSLKHSTENGTSLYSRNSTTPNKSESETESRDEVTNSGKEEEEEEEEESQEEQEEERPHKVQKVEKERKRKPGRPRKHKVGKEEEV